MDINSQSAVGQIVKKYLATISAVVIIVALLFMGQIAYGETGNTGSASSNKVSKLAMALSPAPAKKVDTAARKNRDLNLGFDIKPYLAAIVLLTLAVRQVVYRRTSLSPLRVKNKW